MAKIKINGELFEFDQDHRPMSEALALEAAMGMRYAEWEDALQGGSAKAMAGFVWLVWRRNGREVDLSKILSGEIEVDLGGLLDSLLEVAQEARRAAEEAGPTEGPDSGPAGTPTTATPISASSPKSSATPPPRSTP